MLRLQFCFIPSYIYAHMILAGLLFIQQGNIINIIYVEGLPPAIVRPNDS